MYIFFLVAIIGVKAFQIGCIRQTEIRCRGEAVNIRFKIIDSNLSNLFNLFFIDTGLCQYRHHIERGKNYILTFKDIRVAITHVTNEQ